MSSPNIRQIPLCYDSATGDASALQLVLVVRPEWTESKEHVEFKRFTDGITNTLLKATLKKPGLSEREANQDAVLLRAYGKGTGVIIDRDRECNSHFSLAQHGLAPPLLARFENGLLYSYLDGSACAPEDLRRPEIWRAVAKRLGEMHSIMTIPRQPSQEVLGSHSHRFKDFPEPNLWSTLRKWLAALPIDTYDKKMRQKYLTDELEFLLGELGGTTGIAGHPFVFCHCDLLSGNVIMEPTTKLSADALEQRARARAQSLPGTTRWGTYYSSHPDRPLSPEQLSKVSDEAEVSVAFIDYEYATPAPAAFDIANHFAEWGGFDCDYSVLPTQSERSDFIQQYVSSFHSNLKAGPVPDAEHTQSNGTNGLNGVKRPNVEADVDHLFAEVDRFRGVPGFYWGIWALIQATISEIDFDYPSYAEQRLGEYWAWKNAEYSASVTKRLKHDEVGLREKRWSE